MKLSRTPNRRQLLSGMTATVLTACATAERGRGEGARGPADTGPGADTGAVWSADDTGLGVGLAGGISVGVAHLSWAADGSEFELHPAQHVAIGRDPGGAERWRLEGLEPDDLNFPWKAAERDGLVYLLLRGSHLIAVLDADGFAVGTIGTEPVGGRALHHPADFAFGPDDDLIYITDPPNHRVVVYTLDGAPVGELGLVDFDAPRHLNCPRGLAFDPDGRLHVVDRGDRCVQVFEADGAWVRTTSSPALVAPESIAIDPGGVVTLSDRHAAVLHVFDPDGQPIDRWIIEVDGWTAHPSQLSWTSDGDLYVHATNLHREDA
jgi:hypothetical protein